MCYLNGKFVKEPSSSLHDINIVFGTKLTNVILVRPAKKEAVENFIGF